MMLSCNNLRRQVLRMPLAPRSSQPHLLHLHKQSATPTKAMPKAIITGKSVDATGAAGSMASL
eukprot:1974324-Prorocentrum_lima.AAC.1